jgi:hypothetical protein
MKCEGSQKRNFHAQWWNLSPQSPRIGALGISMAQNLSCKINVESWSLLRTIGLWPEGHGLRSSEVGGIRSVS